MSRRDRLCGLFYPAPVHLSRNLNLKVVALRGKLPRLSNHRLDYVFCATGVDFPLLMLPYAFSSF